MLIAPFSQQVFPIFYCLTTRKTAKSYIALFEFIQKKLMLLIPAEIMTDFEEGLRLACKKTFKDFILRGCWFHFCSALRKRCNKLGMKKFVQLNPVAKFVLKALMSLPLLPAHQIVEGYESIKNFASKLNLLRFPELLQYFESYWLKKVKTALFFTRQNIVIILAILLL